MADITTQNLNLPSFVPLASQQFFVGYAVSQRELLSIYSNAYWLYCAYKGRSPFDGDSPTKSSIGFNHTGTDYLDNYASLPHGAYVKVANNYYRPHIDWSTTGKIVYDKYVYMFSDLQFFGRPQSPANNFTYSFPVMLHPYHRYVRLITNAKLSATGSSWTINLALSTSTDEDDEKQVTGTQATPTTYDTGEGEVVLVDGASWGYVDLYIDLDSTQARREWRNKVSESGRPVYCFIQVKYVSGGAQTLSIQDSVADSLGTYDEHPSWPGFALTSF